MFGQVPNVKSAPERRERRSGESKRSRWQACPVDATPRRYPQGEAHRTGRMRQELMDSNRCDPFGVPTQLPALVQTLVRRFGTTDRTVAGAVPRACVVAHAPRADLFRQAGLRGEAQTAFPCGIGSICCAIKTSRTLGPVAYPPGGHTALLSVGSIPSTGAPVQWLHDSTHESATPLEL